MKLFSFNFFISHRSSKINLANASFRRLDYKNKNQTINKILLILQQKLIKIKSLINLIFIVIRATYKENISDISNIINNII